MYETNLKTFIQSENTMSLTLVLPDPEAKTALKINIQANKASSS